MSDAMATALAILAAIQAFGILCTAIALTVNLRLLFDVSLHLNSISSSARALRDASRNQKDACPTEGPPDLGAGTIHRTEISADSRETSGRLGSMVAGSPNGAPSFGKES